MRVAYLDPVCGISGDMFVACALDAGLPLETLRRGLGALPLKGYEIYSKSVLKNSISATRFFVKVAERGGEHRNFARIASLIDESGLASGVKESALRTFRALAEAEGEVHGVAPEEVTFHEVGAVDSIVDIVSAAIAMDAMKLERLLVGALPTGRGTAQTAHGSIPVPAPATVKLLRGFDLVLTRTEGELVTPTGAAIIKSYGSPLSGRAPVMKLEAVGCGAGSVDFEGMANIARLLVGELREEEAPTRPVDVLEATLDDASPELLGYLTGRLLKAGAYDAFLTPVIMKKSRPGVHLTVLSAPERSEELAAIVFRESPTLGIRVSRQSRLELQRRIEIVSTRFGNIQVKVSVDAGGRTRCAPEYEACASIASARGLPFTEVWEEARKAWENSQEE